MQSDGLSGILLAQIDVEPGRPDLNFRKIRDGITYARRQGADLVIFPEMALPGYLLGDRWECEAFLRDIEGYNRDIRELSQGLTVVWGSVWTDPDRRGEDGRPRKYNAALIASDGEWANNGVFVGRTIKTLLPKYREFDDERHFYSLLKLAHERGKSLSDILKPFPVSIRGRVLRMGVSLCEDMWHEDYADNPIQILIDNGADFVVNISASPWTWRKNDKRHRVVRGILTGRNVPFLYCNNVGAQNNGKNVFLFDGNSTVYGKNGALLARAGDYVEEFLAVTIPAAETATLLPTPVSAEQDTEELHLALITGLKKFFSNRPQPRALVGLSGGIDSALVAALLAEAIGEANVFAVNMPTRFNSELTQNNAAQLSENLGIHYGVVPIQELFELTSDKIAATEFIRCSTSRERTKITLTNFIKENIQARHRGATILSALSAALGAVYTNNGNKTETALGYATLYGDINGAIAPIADLYKSEVYALARHINQKAGRELIPEAIFTVVPSAELSADQDVTKGLGDPIIYPYHDKLVRAFVEFRRDPEDILKLYLDDRLEEKLLIPKGTIAEHFPKPSAFVADLEDKWRLFNLSIFKRIQAPPIIAVSRRAFGFDLRESQNALHFTREYLRLKAVALAS